MAECPRRLEQPPRAISVAIKVPILILALEKPLTGFLPSVLENKYFPPNRGSPLITFKAESESGTSCARSTFMRAFGIVQSCFSRSNSSQLVGNLPLALACN
jgi:hypothetical protein